jgi:hypothetical protein
VGVSIMSFDLLLADCYGEDSKRRSLPRTPLATKSSAVTAAED